MVPGYKVHGSRTTRYDHIFLLLCSCRSWPAHHHLHLQGSVAKPGTVASGHTRFARQSTGHNNIASCNPDPGLDKDRATSRSGFEKLQQQVLKSDTHLEDGVLFRPEWQYIQPARREQGARHVSEAGPVTRMSKTVRGISGFKLQLPEGTLTYMEVHFWKYEELFCWGAITSKPSFNKRFYSSL